ncbi:insulinase family protein [Desulforhabdus amnigena]|jgi:Zn-dependent M16 (insulinase) family peptidase|uniref:Peptidase M16 n=1 Tax=Desulforhabdus amnigena TaxID=40218 RepID=A0A9W6FSF3_9BACT|nr:insulinase family protein [Desulforhabdus amnigena]NLJ29446.1 peptidase M16 [Deltaproteobacteria bacterium]GLI33993.1 peptidase M16 [Desulforhabdus amnigena]
MTITHGFELVREENIEELKTRARLYRHIQTGAELLSLSNDDENKVFGISFRTPPKDSTGVAHILEHSVLCGSRKYPVKEPFVELLKGSLKTFLNAFTYPDKTCYPVASQNVQDFYNLVDVYLDAVFYPRITPFVLQQEGWHLELENPDLPLTYKGVVYNEMKGAYSSPDNVLAEFSQQSIFPDNTYGLDSGGNPKEIPNLTFEQFKEFHEKYYHPSNARIFFCGDDDPDERLRLVNEYLKEFQKIAPDSQVQLQRPFDAPRRIVRSFASGREDSAGGEAASKGMITVNWLLPETTDPELNLSFQILQYVLLGMPGSPLRKALIDSGLGDDLAGVGLESDLRQMYFSTGLKGIAIENADRIEALILDTLSRMAKDGIDRQTIEAALNTIEFRLRENNTGSFPRGLVLMLRSLTTWLYDGNPFSLLAFEAPLAAVKSRLKSGAPYFEKLIEEYFLNNSHRTTLVLTPDPKLAEKEEADERARLAAIRESMTSEQLKNVVENTHALQRLQETPDPPEALATIPTLKISDLEKRNKVIPKTVLQKNGREILFHDIFTSGIVYLDIAFNLHTLPQKYLPYIPLFGRSLVEMGTEKEDFVALSQRISAKTGGLRTEVFTSAVQDSKKARTCMILRGKSMLTQTEDLLNILQDVLLRGQLDNRERFRQMVMEEKARQEQKLVPNGHQIVNIRLRSHFGEADWAAEQMSGISYLFFIRQLARQVDSDWPGVLHTLEEIRRILVNRNEMLFNVTLDASNFSRFEPQLANFMETLPAAASSEVEWAPEHPPEFEGLMIPAQVNYVGKGANLYDLGYRFHGSTQVITGYLRTSWLWERIRVQGGAYGAFCLFDRHSGMFTFVSYRDPNLLKTLNNFDQASEFLRHADLNEDELTKGIIGAIGNMDSYYLPDAKGYMSMLRHITGDTDEIRQKIRDEVLSTTAADFRAFADILDEVKKRGIVKVLGSQSAMEETDSERPGWLNLLKVL